MSPRSEPLVAPGLASRLAETRVDVAAADAAVMLLNAVKHPGQPDFVTGVCGHPMTGQDWIAGWRYCKACPEGLFTRSELTTPGHPGSSPGDQP
jgi:hypothetical protein